MKPFKKCLLGLCSSALIITPITPFAVSCSTDEVASLIKDETIKQFKEIDLIPHASNVNGTLNSQEKIKAYYKKYIENLGLTWVNQENGADYEGSAYFDIPATKGWEDKKPIILQGHMDIVFVAPSGTDRTNYQINLVEKEINGEPVICSDGTTNIGADDGVGIGTMLALAKYRDKYNHGPIRCIFTTDEEEGCVGAKYVPESWFKMGDQQINDLLNLDSEELTELTVASSGVYRPVFSCDFENTNIVTNLSSNSEITTYQISATGFNGGHTSNLYRYIQPMEPIMDCLKDLLVNYQEFYLSDIETDKGLEKSTGVPKNAYLQISVNTKGIDIKNQLQGDINVIMNMLLEKFPEESRDAKCSVIKVDNPSQALNKETSNNIYTLLATLPNGRIIYNVTDQDKNTNGNLSPVVLKVNDSTNGNFTVTTMLRSFDDDLIAEYKSKMNKAYTDYLSSYKNAKKAIDSEYVAWLGKDNSLIQLLAKGYNSVNINPTVTYINAGLETSWFARYVKNQATTGPTATHAHETSETLYLNTITPYIKIVLYTLANLN